MKEESIRKKDCYSFRPSNSERWNATEKFNRRWINQMDASTHSYHSYWYDNRGYTLYSQYASTIWMFAVYSERHESLWFFKHFCFVCSFHLSFLVAKWTNSWLGLEEIEVDFRVVWRQMEKKELNYIWAILKKEQLELRRIFLEVNEIKPPPLILSRKMRSYKYIRTQSQYWSPKMQIHVWWNDLNSHIFSCSFHLTDSSCYCFRNSYQCVQYVAFIFKMNIFEPLFQLLHRV